MSSEEYRIDELKKQLSESLEHHTSASGYLWPDKDLWVEGPLSQIVEWARDWRSEIEELG